MLSFRRSHGNIKGWRHRQADHEVNDQNSPLGKFGDLRKGGRKQGGVKDRTCCPGVSKSMVGCP